MQRLWTLVPGHLSSHSALSSYGLFAPLSLWRLSVSLRPLVQTLGSCPASGAPWSSAMPPSPGRGRVTNNNNKELKAVPLLHKQKPQQLLRLIQRSISIRQADIEIFVIALLGCKFELAVLAHILHVLDVLALLGGS